MRSSKKRTSTKRLTLGALMVALGVVVLYLGSLVEVLDISMAVIASFCCVVAVIELGGASPWLVFGATSIISLILLPQKMPAVMYFVFFGYYPIIKEKLERIRSKLILWLIKILIFNAAILVSIFVAKRFLMLTETIFVFEIVFILLANLTLILYDIAMTRAVTFYLFRLRKRLRIDKF